MTREIVIVEDEPTIRDNYTEMLIRQGYQVRAYATKSEAEVAFNSKIPDLVLLDIGLGDDIEGGFDLCRQLRKKSESLPIIFLTARDNDFDTISGLRLGADDYLTKDISLPHLSARISALFRRISAINNKPAQEKTLILDQLKVNLERLEVQWHDQTVDLSLTEFWMVHSLTKHPGHVRSREQLMDDASTVVDDSTITSHIKRIRKKFNQIEKQFDCIETVYGAGYRWRCH
ncbi:MAG: proteobacterial dedicated sortase system response regulator [Gammaproteobacteria bacterium]|nr:proteobacterial dedicated sortase system response regulator [Gammaproteobacteria bacterium]